MALLPRINPIFAIPASAMTLPFIGLWMIDRDPDSYEFILDGHQYTPIPFQMYAIFIGVFVLTWAMFSPKKLPVPVHRDDRKVGSMLVWLSLAGLGLLLTQINPLDVLSGSMTKLDVRETGSLVATVNKYFQPVVFAYACLVYRFDRQRISFMALATVAAISSFVGLSTGAKAGIIFTLLPGIIALTLTGMRWRTAILLGGLGIAALVIGSLMFDAFVQDDGVPAAANYVAYRAFILTAEVPYRATEQILSGESFDYAQTLASAATNTVVTNIIDDPSEAYQYNFAKSLSAILYPDLIDQVKAGRWNLTPTVFAEGVVAFGLTFFWLMAAIVALIGTTIQKAIYRKASQQRYSAAAVMLCYFVFIYMAWINSGGIAVLINPLVVITLFAVYLALRLIEGQREMMQAAA